MPERKSAKYLGVTALVVGAFLVTAFFLMFDAGLSGMLPARIVPRQLVKTVVPSTSPNASDICMERGDRNFRSCLDAKEDFDDCSDAYIDWCNKCEDLLGSPTAGGKFGKLCNSHREIF